MARESSDLHQFGFEAPAAVSTPSGETHNGWRAADGRPLPLAAPSEDTPPPAPRRTSGSVSYRETASWEAALARARLRAAAADPESNTMPTQLGRPAPITAEEAHWRTALAVARARAADEERREAEEWEAVITRARARTNAEDGDEEVSVTGDAPEPEAPAAPAAAPGVRKSAPTLNLRMVRATGDSDNNARPLPGLPAMRRVG